MERSAISDIASPAFATWHRWDRTYHLTFVAAAWVAVLAGFYPTVAARHAGHADYSAPPILQLHVFSFAVWLCLLTIQVLLVRGGKLALHRSLGSIGALLIPVMVVTAIWAEVYSQIFYAVQDPENLRFFILPLTAMALFGIFGILALVRRKDAAAHKRMIVLATAVILSAAHSRWWGDAVSSALGEGYWTATIENFAGPNLLMAIALGYDFATRRRVQPLLGAMVASSLLAEVLAAIIYNSGWWPGFARHLLGI